MKNVNDLFQDCMVDLETMGNGPEAAIVSIGAVMFNKDCGSVGKTFYLVVDLASSINHGGKVTASTIMWWLQQNQTAREALYLHGSASLPDALLAFKGFLDEFGGDVRVWGNGAGFDNVILESAYRNCGIDVPWEFYNNRCHRTYVKERPAIPRPDMGVKHHALDDAMAQVSHLLAVRTVLNGGLV